MAKVIAEISGNHEGELGYAEELIRLAAQCGCDAVKFQAYLPEDMDDPTNDIYEDGAIPRSWYAPLFARAKKCKIPLFASVFATREIPIIAQYEPWAFKIASPESTPLAPQTYREIAATVRGLGFKLIMSAGRNSMGMLRSIAPDISLYCKAGYAIHIDDDDLAFMQTTDGFSDHTVGLVGPLAMLQAGAEYIEKHFRFTETCIDREFSLTPPQMRDLCDKAHR